MRNKIFEKVPIKIPNRSGFDLSHEVTGTAKAGLLVPVMSRYLNGNDSISVNVGSQIQFFPFATDFYGRIKCYIECFFVPLRILDGGYKRSYTRALNPTIDTANKEGYYVNPYLPGGTFTIKRNLLASETDGPLGTPLGRGQLLDYLGMRIDDSNPGIPNTHLFALENIYKLLAYHMIYQEYYRDSRIQSAPFAEFYNGDQQVPRVYAIPFSSTPLNDGNKFYYSLDTSLLNDGYHLLGLRSRNYAKDYFTVASAKPQFGNEMGFSVDSNGRVTISQVRAANALQHYMELYNIAGTHYDDLAFALTGIRPSDAAVDIPIYLGRNVFDVYVKSVFNQYATTSTATSVSEYQSGKGNPAIVPGAKYGNGQALSSGHLFDFTATEKGVLMVLLSVAPDALYGSGVDREWYYTEMVDFPSAQLAGIGDQPLYKGEVVSSGTLDDGGTTWRVNRSIFGYSQRFAEGKFMLDTCHGELRDGGSLSSFSLKRSFDTAELGSAFLKVPYSALDDVSYFKGSQISNAGRSVVQNYWYDIFFETKLVSNLPAYSIPTLEDPDGHTVMVDNIGRRL